MTAAKFTSSQRMQAVQTPIIPVVAEWLRQYPEAISLGQGVVFYGPPAAALAAAQDYPADPAAHRYGPVEGEPPLRAALETKLRTENHIGIGDATVVVVSAGSNMAFMNALFAITDPGDEVILLSPYYFNHEMAIRMLGCTCVAVPTLTNYQPDIDAIAAHIGPRTRAVVTVSPNNPTGAVYPAQTLTEINNLCAHHGIYHINDEAYEYFTYETARHFSPASLPTAAAHTISLFSFSKAYGFAGWRIGYAVLPQHLQASVQKAQDTHLICPTRIAQYAASAALAAGRNYCMTESAPLTETRRQVLAACSVLTDICDIPAADGAFYLLLRVHTRMDAFVLAQRLIAEHGVAVIPGATFGCDDGCYLRVSYGALAGVTALKGIDRLVHGLQTLVRIV